MAEGDDTQRGGAHRIVRDKEGRVVSVDALSPDENTIKPSADLSVNIPQPEGPDFEDNRASEVHSIGTETPTEQH